MADWEEIKALQADFQRAQLTVTTQRLSERNCVEIVQCLQNLNLIEVIYTTDGKEYLTPQEILKEIREELLVHDGRVNLVELAQIINVDFSHIETKVNELLKGSSNLQLVLGQLIDASYLDNIAEEINDKLQDKGQIILGELAKAYDLPGDFLAQAIDERLGIIIKGQQDSQDRSVIFTETFVSRHRAMIRGAFSAVTKPITVSMVLNRYKLQAKMFFTLLEELISIGRLAGSVSGGRQPNTVYIPLIFTRAQNAWVDNFYKQNGYLEYDGLERLGIGDAKAFIKKRFPGEKLLYLSSCVIGNSLVEHVEAEIDEALATNTYIDLMSFLPSTCTEGDTTQLISQLLKQRTGAQLYAGSIVVSDRFVTACRKPFDELVQNKAEQVARTDPGRLAPVIDKRGSSHGDVGVSRDDKKDHRKKKGVKTGFSTQGREVKTKAVKKKYLKGRDEDSDEEDAGGTSGAAHNRPSELEFMSVTEIEEVLTKQPGLDNSPPEFLTELAEQLHRPLSREFTEQAKTFFLTSMGTSSGSGRKRNFGELTEKVHGLWCNIKLFEKGLAHFSDDVQIQLKKHLLKTVCMDIVNQLIQSYASENMVAVSDGTVTTHQSRQKLLEKIGDEKVKASLARLNGTLSGKSVEEFLACLDEICNPSFMSISLKKPDKKKERQLVFAHRQGLAEQLRVETDAALALHTAAVLLFQAFTQCLLYAPGKCVPSIVDICARHMQYDDHMVLIQCQDLVVQKLRLETENAKTENPSEGPDTSDICRQLEELVPKVKDIALVTKKSISPTAAAEGEGV